MRVPIKILLCFAGIAFFLVITGFFLPLKNNTNTKVLSEFKKIATNDQPDPKVVIEEITAKPFVVLYTNETAASTGEISKKLGAAYGEMGAFMKKNNLQMAGAPAATYQSQHAPFTFEAWVHVNSAPAKGEGRIQFKNIDGGKAVVAHVFGPYELGYKGFEKLMVYIKEKGLTALPTYYEVYANDPTTVKDPYEIQTDIYQLVK